MKKTLICLPLICLLISACTTANPEPVSKSGFFFDTYITITLYNHADTDILDGALELCDYYDTLLSRTNPESDVWRANHADGQPVEISEDMRTLLETALFYAERSGGAYDITICPVVDLWDFTGENPVLPESSDILAALEHVGYQNVVLNENTLTLLNGAQIDLGSIAKGHIADEVAAYLRENGVEHAIINLGGNVLTVGGKPSGEPFRIGIQRPYATHNEIIGTVAVQDLSVVSSGIYERFFELDGTHYHHILNTATGYPVENNLLSVTILSQKSTDGDALSTLCFALGLEDGMALIESIPDTEAAFLTKDSYLHFTSGFGKTVFFEAEPAA